jgi:glycosyltransferase involved in cell wall biosynthesis
MKSTPLVTVGLPVFNGENFLGQAIESVLSQTFTDFELVIGDNASTDSTEEVCRSYNDTRIRYIRNSRNIGGAPNYNLVFNESRSPFFKWLAHDDLMEPTFLEKTVPVLEKNSDLSIVHCRTLEIDKNSQVTGNFDHELSLSATNPSHRFRRILWAGYFNEVFGLMRSDIIRRTKLHGSFAGSDRNLMAHLLLLGNISYVDEYLFLRRHHPDCYCIAQKTNLERIKWYNPDVKMAALKARLTALTKYQEYSYAVFHSNLPTVEQIECVKHLAEWTFHRSIESMTNRHEQ